MSVNKKKILGVGTLVVLLISGIVAVALGGKIVETVPKGTYHIKQAAVSGKLTAHMTPGMYMQNFGDIEQFPKSDTFFFTADADEGTAADQSIEVRFNDGSLCDISGTCRIIMPTSETDALALANDLGYKTYADVEAKLIKPVIRDALRMSANFMSAKESYAERRSEFNDIAKDQIENGTYRTSQKQVKVLDPISGEEVTTTVVEILRDENGNALRSENPLAGTGITVKQFEVKAFKYETRVVDQIKRQQEANMAVQTARAEAARAEQDKITIEAEGRARVMAAKYERETEKVQAEVVAEQEKQVALIAAQKLVEQAELERQQNEIILETTKLQAEAVTVEATAQAGAKKALIEADGALQLKLDALVEIAKAQAEAIAQRKVASTVIVNGSSEGSGVTGTDAEVQTLLQLMVKEKIDQLKVDSEVTQ